MAAPTTSGKAIYANRSSRPYSSAAEQSPVSSPHLELREDFEAQAKNFFGVVQGMKDRGEWKSRRDYRRMTQHGGADEEEVDIWSTLEGSSVAAPQAKQQAAAPAKPTCPCPVLLGFTQEANACDQQKAEFAAEAKYFFNAVQDMKDQGQWQARRAYKRMTQHGMDEEEMDIWKGALEDPSELQCAEETPEVPPEETLEVPQKLPKAKFPPRVLLGSEVTQQNALNRTNICDGRKLEFAEQAQYFFGAVQDMKDNGQWQARRDYKRMSQHGEGEDLVDIWS